MMEWLGVLIVMVVLFVERCEESISRVVFGGPRELKDWRRSHHPSVSTQTWKLFGRWTIGRRVASVIIALVALPLSAQTPQYDLTRHPDGYVIVTRRPERLGPSYWLMYGLSLTAALYDAKTTHDARDRCISDPLCSGEEANFLMRPIINQGRDATYAFTIGVTAIQMEVARRMKRRGERSWIVGPAIGAGAHTAAAISTSRK